MNEKTKKLLSNTMIFTVGKFISKIIVFIMLPFYTSCLTSAEYSTADLIANLCNLIIPMAALGVSEGIFRAAADKNDDKEAFLTNGIFIMLCGCGVFLALSPLLSLWKMFTPYVWLIVLYVIASNIHSVCSQYICAIGKSNLFAFQGILNTAITVILNIIFLAGIGLGVEGYILSIILADFLSAVFVFFVSKLYRSIKPKKINRTVIKALLKFCLPLVPSTVFWWITGVSDRYMVSAICSPEENGLYAVAYKIPTLLTYVVIIFNDAWKISAVSDADDMEQNAKFYSSTYKLYQAIMFIGGGFICILSWVFARILFAEGFRSAWVFVPILTVATVFSSLDTFLGSAYFTVRKTGMSLITSFIGAAINIALNFALIKPYGAMGASVATLASYFLVYVIRASTMNKFIPFKTYPIRVLINTALVGGMAASITAMGMTLPSIAISCALLLACVLYNGRDLYSAVKGIAAPILRRIKK